MLSRTLVLAFKFFSRSPLAKLIVRGGVEFMAVGPHTIYFLVAIYFTAMVREVRFLFSNSRAIGI